MKILLLTCSTGEGHNSAAVAIYDELIREGHLAEIVYSNHLGEEKRLSKFDKWYNNLITRAPAVFGFIYVLGLICNKAVVRNAIYLKNKKNVDEYYHYILDNKFDAVICTHPFSMAKMTAVRKKYNLNIPTFGVLTDYTYIPFTNNSEMDKYFIAHKDLARQLESWKIPVDKQAYTGIPSKIEFAEELSKSDARESLQLPQDKKIILVVGGAVGCKNIYGLCKYFKFLKDENTLVYVITGRNEKMLKKIKERYEASGIIPIAFTDILYKWIKACDVVITKPGGLSSTEFAVANVPIVHLRARWGCEKRNAKFFSHKGMSKLAKNNYSAVKNALNIANNPDIAKQLKDNLKENINPYASRDIIMEVSKYV